MTTITFYKKNNLYLGFEVAGHTGKDDFGKDLLCCQISTIAQLAVVGLDEIEKKASFRQISDGFLKIMVQPKDAASQKIQFLLETCFYSFKSIVEDEKKFAKLEVKNV